MFEPAGEVDYLLVTPAQHPLLRQKNLRLEAVVEYPSSWELLMLIPGTGSHEVFHRHELSLRDMQISAETSSDEYTLSCVRAGLGIGITVGNGRGLLYRGLGVRSLNRPGRHGSVSRSRGRDCALLASCELADLSSGPTSRACPAPDEVNIG